MFRVINASLKTRIIKIKDISNFNLVKILICGYEGFIKKDKFLKASIT